MVPAVTGPFCTEHSAISAAMPTRRGFSSAFKPRATIVRFSPVRGITSATVPRQRKSQY